MTRGRKPTPTNIVNLRGNPGKRKHAAPEPQPAGDLPACPEFLSADARREWDRIMEVLRPLSLVTAADRAALAAYCVAYARWAEAERQIEASSLVVKVGKSQYPMSNPFLPIANKAMEQMHKFLAEFGMNPSSRARIFAGHDDRDNAFAQYQRRRPGA